MAAAENIGSLTALFNSGDFARRLFLARVAAASVAQIDEPVDPVWLGRQIDVSPEVAAMLIAFWSAMGVANAMLGDMQSIIHSTQVEAQIQ